MKIKTITCHDVYNTGASLQAYALMSYLEKQGNDVEIIDYKPDYLSNHYKLFAISNPKYSENVFLGLAYILLKLPGRVISLQRKKVFDKFTKKYLKTTGLRYKSNQELKENLPVADVYIAGSDQIWNTIFKNGRDPAFYLDFVPKDRIKASYAASFATESVKEEFKTVIKNRLKRFDYISVRETSGIKILDKLGIDYGVQVLDPVFLIDKDQWLNLCNANKSNQKYILVYDFDNSEILKSYACKIAKEKNYKIYSVLKNNLKYVDKYSNNDGPIEFLTLIKNAEFVISNSFHATAFSVIFQKQFLVINRKEHINTRMRDFLGLVGLQDRLVNESKIENIINDINFSLISDNLNNLIQKSKEYLELILK